MFLNNSSKRRRHVPIFGLHKVKKTIF